VCSGAPVDQQQRQVKTLLLFSYKVLSVGSCCTSRGHHYAVQLLLH
jgi:hypothetical protein